MTLSVCIIMDPPDQIDPFRDTTFRLALEAQKRGIHLYYSLIEGISLRGAKPYGKVQEINFIKQEPYYKILSEARERPLDDFDQVFMRKDPPFDERYFFATHLLCFCKKAQVLNRPQSIILSPEKVYPYQFPGIFPPNVISSDKNVIRRFLEEQEPGIIVKPLNGCGGQGIVYLHAEDKNFASIIEMMTNNSRDFITAQRYLPEVRQGDKRVICLNGKAVGAIARIPDSSDHRANIHVGGKTELVKQLNPREKWLVEQVGKQLSIDGHYFVGLDIIGDFITEINVTSPTGIQEIEQRGGIDIASLFWDGLS